MEAIRRLLVVVFISWPSLVYAQPPWAHDVKKTVIKAEDFEEIVVEVNGVKAGYRYDHGRRFDLKWERDPKTLGLTHRLHAHEITRVFPPELDPLPTAMQPVPDAPIAAADTAPVVIDVNYFYTAASAAANGGESTMPAFAALSCALANQAYVNSGIGYITFRCLGPFKASYADTTNLNDALNWMGTTGAGASEIAAKYALTGADVSQMTVKYSGGGCGLGWLTASKTNALSVTDRTCANSNLSSPHEIGHNLGFNHDPANAGCGTLVLKPSGLMGCASGYNYGHSFPIGAPQWRTFMAYPNAGGIRVTVESGTNVTYNGYATGIVNERDNVLVAVARAPIVSQFRTATTTSHKPSAVTNVTILQ
jgi:hypothetical protein